MNPGTSENSAINSPSEATLDWVAIGMSVGN